MTEVIAEVWCGHSEYANDVWTLMPTPWTMAGGALEGYDYSQIAVLLVLAGATIKPNLWLTGYSIEIAGDRDTFLARLTALLKDVRQEDVGITT